MITFIFKCSFLEMMAPRGERTFVCAGDDSLEINIRKSLRNISSSTELDTENPAPTKESIQWRAECLSIFGGCRTSAVNLCTPIHFENSKGEVHFVGSSRGPNRRGAGALALYGLFQTTPWVSGQSTVYTMSAADRPYYTPICVGCHAPLLTLQMLPPYQYQQF